MKLASHHFFNFHSFILHDKQSSNILLPKRHTFVEQCIYHICKYHSVTVSSSNKSIRPRSIITPKNLSNQHTHCTVKLMPLGLWERFLQTGCNCPCTSYQQIKHKTSETFVQLLRSVYGLKMK